MMASEPRSSFIVPCTLLYPSSLRVLRELKAYIRQSKSEKSFCWKWELWPKPQCRTLGTFDQIMDGPSFLSWLGLKTLSHKPLAEYWNFPERLTKITNVSREGNQPRKTEKEPSQSWRARKTGSGAGWMWLNEPPPLWEQPCCTLPWLHAWMTETRLTALWPSSSVRSFPTQ